MASPVRWAVLTLVSLFIGLVVYLILRPEEGVEGTCPNCGRAVGAEKFCPFCGTPSTHDFCRKCGYPARADWSYCPNCQTAIQKALEPSVPAAQEPPPVQIGDAS